MLGLVAVTMAFARIVLGIILPPMRMVRKKVGTHRNRMGCKGDSAKECLIQLG